MSRLSTKVKQLEINSDALNGISISILNQYPIEKNLHFILLLSYLTVKEYSRNITHLDKNAKIELCMKYTPDLLSNLNMSEIIDDEFTLQCKHKFADNNVDMIHIFETYYLLFLHRKEDAAEKDNICCF